MYISERQEVKVYCNHKDQQHIHRGLCTKGRSLLSTTASLTGNKKTHLLMRQRDMRHLKIYTLIT